MNRTVLYIIQVYIVIHTEKSLKITGRNLLEKQRIHKYILYGNSESLTKTESRIGLLEQWLKQNPELVF